MRTLFRRVSDMYAKLLRYSPWLAFLFSQCLFLLAVLALGPIFANTDLPKELRLLLFLVATLPTILGYVAIREIKKKSKEKK